MEFEKIRQIIAEHLGKNPEDINMGTSFVDDLGADSLDLFELVCQLEEACKTEFNTEDLDKITTVGDVVKFLQKE